MKIVRLTPPERGAVASYLLNGEGVLDIFLRFWKGKAPTEQPHCGRLQITDDGDCEEAVVFKTGENSLEIHVHGGKQIASAIETLFQRNGVICKTWQEHFAQGTFQQDLALRLLPFAPTERTAQILLDQYNGAYDREMTAMKLLPLEEQQRHRQRLAQLVPLGKHLVEPFKVVLAGASNAGKSTLLNAVLGFQRSIVHQTPGTTRDVVSGQTALDGFPVTFLDTAGFRLLHNSKDDELERQGIDRTLQSLTDADLVVWVVDLTVEKPKRLRCPIKTNVLCCWNKRDLVPCLHSNLSQEGKRTPVFSSPLSEETGISVSALTGEGVESLLCEILHRLVPFPPMPGEAVPL